MRGLHDASAMGDEPLVWQAEVAALRRERLVLSKDGRLADARRVTQRIERLLRQQGVEKGDLPPVHTVLPTTEPQPHKPTRAGCVKCGRRIDGTDERDQQEHTCRECTSQTTKAAGHRRSVWTISGGAPELGKRG